jgi:hypothetical protein
VVSAASRLNPNVVVAIAVVLPASLALVHLARGIAGDVDVASVYPAEGGALLHGTYPHSEYPPGVASPVLFVCALTALGIIFRHWGGRSATAAA